MSASAGELFGVEGRVALVTGASSGLGDNFARVLARAGASVVAQYAAFKVDDIQVNGKLTLSENIADQGGLAIAYAALQKAVAGKSPGLIDGFTPQQRFFLSYAEAWRTKLRPEVERLYLRVDGHSLPRFRVQGPLQQSPEFARAFSCEPSRTLISESQRANIW